MVYGGLNLEDYPRKSYVPGRYDPNRIHKSQYLKPGQTLPLPPSSDPELNCVGQELQRLLGELHTSLNFPKTWAAKVRLVPDTGTPAEGVDWLLPHVDEYNAITFDSESCTKEGGVTYAILGSVSGHVLLVDLRQFNRHLPEVFKPLIEGRLVLGAALHNDVSLLRPWNFHPADTLPFSAKIQRHPLYPYRSAGKTSLKYIPEMVYGHHYGGKYEKVRKGGQLVLCPHFRKHPQPFSWPRWLNPVDIYDFSSPLNEQQLAYMKNDALAPVVHVLLYGIMELSAGEVNASPVDVRSVVCHALNKGFGLVNDFEVKNPPLPDPADLITFEDLDREFANEISAPNWEWAHGLQSGLNDVAMREKLLSFPVKIREEIKNYATLNPIDDDDQVFLDLFGGFPHLSALPRCLRTSRPRPSQTWTKGGTSGWSRRPETPLSLPQNAPRQDALSPQEAPECNRGTDCKPPPSSSEHIHGPKCKKRKIEVEMWECPMEGFVMVVIPTPNPEALKNTPAILANKDEIQPHPEPVEDNLLEVEPSQRDLDSEMSTVQVNAALETVPPPRSETPSVQVNAAPKVALLRKPHDVGPEERLRLLQGMLEDVPLPEPIRLPHCFTGVPLFRSRCQACGYRSGRKGHNTVHPVGACPVLANLAKLYYNFNEQRWVQGHRPCEYRLCRNKTSHLEKMCPMLHSFCLQCGLRGHRADDCTAAHQRFGVAELESAYDASRKKGVRSRKQHPVSRPRYRSCAK